jgi:hypothetical protein
VIAALRELSQHDQWVGWRLEVRDGRPTKPPYAPDGRRASHAERATWASYRVARVACSRHHFDGLGFVLSAEDPFVGVDLDACRDAETGAIAPWAQSIVDRLNSYTEVSPSGTGIHLFARGRLPGRGRKRYVDAGPSDANTKRPALEIYDKLRFFTVSGQHVDGTPNAILDRADEVLNLYAEWFGNEPTSTPEPGIEVRPVDLDDQELIGKARAAKNGSDFDRLWRGDWRGAYASQSEGDLALARSLAWWTNGDRGRVDTLFRASGLYRSKWDRQDYRDGTIDTALAGLKDGYTRGLPHNEVGAALPSLEAAKTPAPKPSEPPWPDPLAPEAFYGPAGDFVRAIQEYTEAAPAALLLHALAGAGACLGPRVHAVAADARHPPRLFVVVVGDSSTARKGSSARPTERALKLADPSFGERILTGLSSGEGLIASVRDAQQRYERVGNRDDRRSELVESDPGVQDKRAWILEQEFASTLRVAQRDGSTLTAVVRLAWDSGDLSTLTKQPLRATGAHVAIVGHVTRDELLRYLDRTELGNGFGNRFLWLAARRARLLPHAGRVPDEPVQRFAETIRAAQAWATQDRRLEWDDQASALWERVYPALTSDRPGLLGAATSRAEAQVLRLALTHAVLDRADAIGVPHLAAALAIWTYTEASARWIFGDATGDQTADTTLAALRNNGELDRTAISALFDRHRSSAQIDRALGLLLRLGLARVRRELTAGRPQEVWSAS